MAEGSAYLEDVYERRTRRRRHLALVLVLGIVYLIFLGGAWAVVRSSLFRIKSIEIQGLRQVSQQEVYAILWGKVFDESFWKRLLGFQNMFVWPKELSADDLRLIPRLKSLTIEKDYRKREVVVRVEERQPIGIWCLNKPAPPQCFWFDDQGVIFKKAPSAEGNLIFAVDDYFQEHLGLGSLVLPPESIPPLLSIFQVLSASGLSIKEIRLEDLGLAEIKVRTYAGPDLYFSLRFPSDAALAVIKSLDQNGGLSKLQYIDFRVQNRAYYK